MSTTDARAVIPAKRRAAWEDGLLTLRPNEMCLIGECKQWDESYNTSDIPVLDARRKADQANYRPWIHSFCKSMSPEVETALETLEAAGGCVKCIGRMLYTHLRLEFISPYLTQQPSIEELRISSDFPDNLCRPRNRAENRLKRALINYMTWKIIQAIKSQCGRAYYEHLAVLLQHGVSVPCHLRGGVFGYYGFHLIEKNFTEAMLRKRAKSGMPPIVFFLIITNLSISRMWSLVRYMRSNSDHEALT